jgi:hypothetical protein
MTRLFIERSGTISELPPQLAKLEQDHLHALIQAHPGILPADEINPERPCKWLVIGSEVLVPDPENGVDRWALDLLLGDQDARPTLVECKRAGNSEIRREMIGQVIEYAANAQYYWDASNLADIARRHYGSDAALDEALHGVHWLDGADAYFNEFERKLKVGEFRIVFAVDSAPHRLRSTVEFLNREFEHVEAMVVEVRRHEVGETTVIASGVLGYSERIRAAKREAAARREVGRYDDESFVRLVDSIGNQSLSAAARGLLASARARGWGVRFSGQGSLLLSPPGFLERTTIALIPLKGGLIEWYIGEFDQRSPLMADGLRKLAATIGTSSNASKYPRSSPDVWTAKVAALITGLETLSRAAVPTVQA